MNHIYEAVHNTNTLLGIKNQLYRDIGVAYIDLDRTLNSADAYNILPSIIPVNPTDLLYFGIGTNGWHVDTETGSESVLIPSASNLNLYNHVPLAIIEQSVVDNDTTSYSDYRLRKLVTIAGVNYYKFYLKKIDITGSDVRLAKVDNFTGSTEPYVYTTPITFTPTPITNNISSEHIVAYLDTKCSINGKEISRVNELLALEYIELSTPLSDRKFIHTISEIGFYTGEDYEHTDTFGNTYNESIGVQLAIHRCMQPLVVSASNINYTIPVNFINGSRTVITE